MFVANAATIETSVTNNRPNQVINPSEINYVWELQFSCDGGETWGTVCCFNTQQEAIDFWNTHQDMLCGWTIED